MSIYSELLRAALEDVGSARFSPLSDDELVARWRHGRRALDAELAGGPASSGPVDARVGDLLACDVLLVQICRRLGIEEHLTDPLAGPRERERVERAAAEAGVSV